MAVGAEVYYGCGGSVTMLVVYVLQILQAFKDVVNAQLICQLNSTWIEKEFNTCGDIWLLVAKLTLDKLVKSFEFVFVPFGMVVK